MDEIELEEPTGKFILDNLPFEKRFQTAELQIRNGTCRMETDVAVAANERLSGLFSCDFKKDKV